LFMRVYIRLTNLAIFDEYHRDLVELGSFGF
jgi:hypothetical protein